VFEKAANANNWTLARKIKIISGHLSGIATSWYNDHKTDLLLWDDIINPNNSFVQAFIKYFLTSECKHQWQIELNTLVQKGNEKIDRYTYQFKRLLRRVDLDHKLPKAYVIRIFLGGLHSKTAMLMSLEDFKKLDDTIAKARKIEAKTYYKNKTIKIRLPISL
ncbi:30076_t:CDS:1, partial [Racocetra persica]